MFDASCMNNLFMALIDFTKAASGDGDGWLISDKHFKEYADMFDEFQKTMCPIPFPTRLESNEAIVFYNHQESVSFIRNSAQLPRWAGDIIVTI
jgi:hypothetical protein